MLQQNILNAIVFLYLSITCTN